MSSSFSKLRFSTLKVHRSPSADPNSNGKKRREDDDSSKGVSTSSRSNDNSMVFGQMGIECYCYHSESSLEEHTRNLVGFQQKSGVFVCTDVAAREFATCAVDFLQRVGRTTKAGQPGLFTSMYNESNHDFVAAVCQAWKLFQHVRKRRKREELSSWKRSKDKKGNTSTLMLFKIQGNFNVCNS